MRHGRQNIGGSGCFKEELSQADILICAFHTLKIFKTHVTTKKYPSLKPAQRHQILKTWASDRDGRAAEVFRKVPVQSANGGLDIQECEDFPFAMEHIGKQDTRSLRVVFEDDVAGETEGRTQHEGRGITVTVSTCTYLPGGLGKRMNLWRQVYVLSVGQKASTVNVTVFYVKLTTSKIRASRCIVKMARTHVLQDPFSAKGKSTESHFSCALK
ncbi:hypothetical protein CAPTEDRAFT_193952 [Capitella teleta]|uniref:Uncharacterized protein n=1 Tax=Capitella teleta TaxID=283909 RepID=R7VCE0_CAPTE|nr:hypothetical protein CAPTEDRAFT_193952 [Capitella teleta]|eukprot:ELU16202.1 hypothetical protein CAPTEDRAFT_193952 [Capitella teleta]